MIATGSDQIRQASIDLCQGTNEQASSLEQVSASMKEIATASNEQSSGTNQISGAVQELNNVVERSAASSEELATIAEQSTSQVYSLKEVLSFFKINNSEDDGTLQLSNNGSQKFLTE